MTGIVTNAFSHSNPNYNSIKQTCSLLNQGDNREAKQLAQDHILTSTGSRPVTPMSVGRTIVPLLEISMLVVLCVYYLFEHE